MKQQVHGNVTGVRDTLIEALGQLYDYEVDEDTFLPRELMQVLARFTGVLNREIAVYITRDGEVVDVSIGTDRDVELRDYRLRRNTQRLSCVRCIHTHPNGDGRLSDVDLSALRSFRYDAMVAIGCLKGEPTFVQSAFLVEKQNLLMDEPVRWYKTPDGDWMRQITESDRIVGWEADEKGTHAKERAVLMGIESMESLDELARLADTAGAEVVGQFLQKKDKPDTALFIGRGRADELCRQCQALEADLCIFDEELTGIQARNLEEILRVKVVDRTTLILDIFAQRARTREGRLQVELAQYQYLLPRLIGMWTHLERQGGTSGKGPIGSKGPGETQLETDRRHIHRKIDKLKAELEEVRRVRGTQRQRRMKNEIPVVAIVGYTNAGKSTLLNAITGAGIPANNRLFDTLDTTTRLLTVSDTLDVVISDTVGFIRKLPHQLVEAFKATLEELEYADLLLHVIDVSNPQWQQQAAIVEDLIHELKADQIPCIRVYNKCDVAFSGERSHEEDAVSISAKTGEGIPALMEAIDRRLDKGTRRVVIHLPYDKAGMLDSLYREAKVEDVAYQESIDVTAVCPPKVLGQLKDYIEGWTEPKEDWE